MFVKVGERVLSRSEDLPDHPEVAFHIPDVVNADLYLLVTTYGVPGWLVALRRCMNEPEEGIRAYCFDFLSKVNAPPLDARCLSLMGLFDQDDEIREDSLIVLSLLGEAGVVSDEEQNALITLVHALGS